MGTASGKQPIKTTSRIELTRAHAENMFPDEKRKKVNGNVFIAESRKAVNKQQKQIFDKELAMSKIAARYGHTVYMLPEKRKGKKCDVIMDGTLTEFKKITRNGNALSHRFREALKHGRCQF
ncbi:hypothetical protein V1L52_04125 [Treponema sp. HNW]|uniref:hypothetical protein n=1 Tax=Treponema sp. HNW TaxID=3116654 RepID=UPI003D0A14E9